MAIEDIVKVVAQTEEREEIPLKNWDYMRGLEAIRNSKGLLS